ncbi:hypothetical protein [Rhodopseudomonas sp. RCAM05734]|uniref:hypothetical protein n=1 Tax=Rhodopseudomonas sp. RCAM05734 TaxID=3457549 RepID=UPI0040444AFC
MPSRVDENAAQAIDRNTSASICNAIGERLRQNLVPASGALPSRLQALLDEMQRQDGHGSRGA